MDRVLEDLLKRLADLPWARILLIAVGLVSLYGLGQIAGRQIIASLDLDQQAAAQTMMRQAMLTALALYVVLTAIPFMPGVEVGLSMLMLLGSKVALLVYLGTITALTLSFLVGRFIPARISARAFGFFGLTRAQDLLMQVAGKPVRERVAILMQSAPQGWAPVMLRHRHLALAILINLPGNMLIGGGGGIAMVAGMSRLFSLPAFLLTVAIAVAPVPLLIYFLRY
jgi:hypothetical protein